MQRVIGKAGQVGPAGVGCVGRAQLEQVDVLGAARGLGRERQAPVLGQRVDRGGLAGVAAAHEGDLRPFAGGQLIQTAGRGQKTRAMGPGQGATRLDLWGFA